MRAQPHPVQVSSRPFSPARSASQALNTPFDAELLQSIPGCWRNFRFFGGMRGSKYVAEQHLVVGDLARQKARSSYPTGRRLKADRANTARPAVNGVGFDTQTSSIATAYRDFARRVRRRRGRLIVDATLFLAAGLSRDLAISVQCRRHNQYERDQYTRGFLQACGCLLDGDEQPPARAERP